MDELERVLRAVARPVGPPRPSARRSPPRCGAGPPPTWPPPTPTTGPRRVAEGLRRDRAVWRDHGAFRMLTGLLRREGMLGPLAALRRPRAPPDQPPPRPGADPRGRDQSEGRSPDELLHWVRTSASSRTFSPGGATTQMRLESDADAVQLVTMHNAKGLEYPGRVRAVRVGRQVGRQGDVVRRPSPGERPPVAHVDGRPGGGLRPGLGTGPGRRTARSPRPSAWPRACA